MAEDEFDIDIYGDAPNDAAEQKTGEDDYEAEGHYNDGNGEGYDEYADQGHDSMDDGHGPKSDISSQHPQGVKRKEGSDDRSVDPGATSALLVSELSWWQTDDDIRGWARQADCEDELVGITFSEHKVNGKSKGQAYLEFTSQHAASATKHLLDSQNGENAPPGHKRLSIIYSSPATNPFKTLPKDAPARAGKDAQSRAPPSQGYNNQGPSNYSGNNNYSGGFRGRGGYNRGGMNQGGYNRNFSGGNQNSFNFNNNSNQNMGGGFNNNMGGGNFGGGGFNRGGFSGGFNRGGGMRGGRGGMNPGMMNMPMGGMNMGGMPNMGGMGMMGGGMPGFQGMPAFNQGFFNNAGMGGGGNQSNDWQQNPHGQKRARGE